MQKCQAVDLGPFDHPGQRPVGEPGARIAAADVGMHADEPDLADPLVIDMRLARPRRPSRRPVLADRKEPVVPSHVAVVPQHGPERVAFLLQRQRMAGADDLVVHELVGHRQRPVPIVDGAGDLVDRPAIGVDGVPDADEFDCVDLDPIEFLIARLAEDRVADEVAQRPQRSGQRTGVEIPLLAIFPVGDLGITREMLLIAVVTDQPGTRDEAGDDADRERAAAEAESVDPVAVLVVAATEGIDVDDVALQSEAERAAEERDSLNDEVPTPSS